MSFQNPPSQGNADPRANFSQAPRSKQLLCPKCRGVLRYPETLGVCIACGYSRSQGGVEPLGAGKAAPKPPSEFTELIRALRRLPTWVWALAGGCVFVIASSIMADYQLGKHSYGRALWGTAELAAGVLMLIGAQIWAMVLVGKHDGDLGIIDAIYPFRVWETVFKSLPEACRPVCLGGWALTATLTSVLLVGGQFYWLPKKKPNQGKPGLVLKEDDEDDEDKYARHEKEDLDIQRIKKKKDIDEDDDQDKEEKKNAPSADPRPTVNCVVIGYVPDEKGGVSGLVLAVEKDGQLQYTGVVQEGLTAEKSEQILSQLSRRVRTESPVPGLNVKAVWVKADVRCEVHQSGTSASGFLIEPKFKELVKANADQGKAKTDK
jgi:hypothetical protein